MKVQMGELSAGRLVLDGAQVAESGHFESSHRHEEETSSAQGPMSQFVLESNQMFFRWMRVSSSKVCAQDEEQLLVLLDDS